MVTIPWQALLLIIDSRHWWFYCSRHDAVYCTITCPGCSTNKEKTK